MPAVRLFFALRPPPAVLAELAGAAGTVPAADARPVPGANFHVTLVFVGEVDCAGLAACERAGAAVRGAPFALELDRAGGFAQARVAWLAPAVVPPALDALVGDLRAALRAEGVPHDTRPFRCHLTIARKLRQPPVARAVPGVRWAVDRYALVESVSAGAGVRYEARAEWRLRPARRDESGPPPVQ